MIDGVAIVVSEYDPDWPVQFRAEAAALTELLARWLAAPIEHIGSTAVLGLDAKPIIDMMAGVRDLTSAQDAIPVLAKRGYVHTPHRPGTLRFSKPRPEDPRRYSHHLHLTEPGSSLWRERLAFRDSLRADLALACEYQQLKETLAAQSPDMAVYTAGKREFVVRVLARAGVTAEDWRRAAGAS